MNILITGVHGFVGSNLVASLKRHHTIYGLDIVSPPTGGVEIAIPKKRDRLFRFATFATYGWHELEHIPPVDCVIHLAGKAHDTKNQANAQDYFDINTGLTQHRRTLIKKLEHLKHGWHR